MIFWEALTRNKLLEFKQDPDPLSAVVDYWLKGNVTEPVVPTAWQSIVTALKSVHVGEPGLAQQIHTKYCQQEENKSEKGRAQYIAKATQTKFIVSQALSRRKPMRDAHFYFASPPSHH